MSRYTTPDFNNCAVLTIDTQNDFSLPGAVAEIAGTIDVIPSIERILGECRMKEVPIVHVIRLYKEDGSNADLCRKEKIETGARIVVPGSSGADLVDTIKPKKSEDVSPEALLAGQIQQIANKEWVIYKPRWGAFYQTHLEAFFRQMNIDTLIFTGCNFPNCPRTSIYQASERDFRAVMIEDAISGVYAKGIDEIRNIGVSVLSTDELIAQLRCSFENNSNR